MNHKSFYKELIIHIGIGKTGTSSIQRMLVDNKEVLEENYYYYPSIALAKDAHHYLANYYYSKPDKIIRESIEEIIRQYHEGNYRVLLLSSEQFCYCKDSYVKEFSSYFHDWNVKIVFYVRKQTDLIKSAFLQKLYEGNDYSHDIATFFRKSKIAFNYLERVKHWEKYFGEDSITVRVFDGKKDICQDFMEAVGLNNIDIQKTSYSVNMSILPDFIKLISLVDGLEPDANSRRAIVDNIKELSEQFKNSSSTALLDNNLINEINEYYKLPNQEFAYKYLCSTYEKELLS